MPFFVLYKQQDEKLFSAIKGFHMSLTTQQPKGQCVWGTRAIFLVTGKHFAEKRAHRIVLPNCWDFFAELGVGLKCPRTAQLLDANHGPWAALRSPQIGVPWRALECAPTVPGDPEVLCLLPPLCR